MNAGADYDPWSDLDHHWPAVILVHEVMTGDLLGETRCYERPTPHTVIALRHGTSWAQSRCTLAHEIVHLERGLPEDDLWVDREERLVHDEAARRLLPLARLITAIADAGGDHDRAALGQLLGVDAETLEVRLAGLTRAERAHIRRRVRTRSAGPS